MNNKIQTRVYIDGSNIYHTQKKLGWFVDWSKFKNLIEEKFEVLEWRYYVGLKDHDDKMKSFLRYLNFIGFTAVTKPLKKIKIDSTDVRISEQEYVFKANFDVEMTVDMLLQTQVNNLIIVGGDSDFLYLIEKLKTLGKDVIVYSSRKTVAWELKLKAPVLIFIEDFAAGLKKQ